MRVVPIVWVGKIIACVGKTGIQSPENPQANHLTFHLGGYLFGYVRY